MANQTGIAITIRAFLQTGKTLNEQFEALSIVKAAHETGDYSALLKAATVEDVKTEQKTRRIEDQPAAITVDPNDPDFSNVVETAIETPTASEAGGQQSATETASTAAADADVPEFLKKDKKSKAA